MLRIDPDPTSSAAYSSPRSNPFVGRDGRDEIWSYGLRNPWRFSFDRQTGALWIGDVGQGEWEEINVASGGSDGGENYGWRRMEGRHSYGGGTAPPGHDAPIYEYSHADGNCSVTGGYVYRGSDIPALRGAYVFADFCAGRLRAFVNEGGRAQGHRFLGPNIGSLASFGEDRDGELYVLSLGGGFYRIAAE
jgi:glucose/arabinose dehydrogenase